VKTPYGWGARGGNNNNNNNKKKDHGYWTEIWPLNGQNRDNRTFTESKKFAS
jgi:hypothetical protein